MSDFQHTNVRSSTLNSTESADETYPAASTDECSQSQLDSNSASASENSSEADQLIIEVRSEVLFLPRRNSSEPSYLIEDPVANRFFNLGIREYQFVCYLDGQKNLRQAYESYSQLHRTQSTKLAGKELLTWDQALKVVDFLRNESLLATVNGSPANQPQLPGSQRISNVNPIGFRLRLFNADQFSEKLTSYCGVVFSRIAVLIWCAAIACALGILFWNFAQIKADMRLLVQPANLFWLSLWWVALKCLHEAGHAIRCKMEGGRVGDAGINFLLVLPMPFIDVTSSWRFASKWKRVHVASAGMYVELFVAAVFMLIWSFDLNPAINSISIQIVLMASLTTLLFNVNPLMKFDGYYIMSDLLRKPNLALNGMRYQRDSLKFLLLGIVPSESSYNFDVATKIYGWLSAIWRVLIAVSLLFAAATFFQGAGIVLAGLALFFWYVKPLVVFVGKCFDSHGGQEISPRRVAYSVCGLVCIPVLLAFVPWPFAPSAIGVIDFSNKQVVRAASDGFVLEIRAVDGMHVEKGDVLAILRNEDLQFELHALKIDREIAELESRRKRRENELGEWQATQRKLDSLKEQIEIIHRQIDELTVRAPTSGTIVSKELRNFVGSYVQTGTEILTVVPNDSLEVVAVVSEFDEPLFQHAVNHKVTIRLENGASLRSTLGMIEPTASRRIFHSAISAENGGPLPIRAKTNPRNADDQSELASPSFKAKTTPLQLSSLDHELRVGQRCRVLLHQHSRSCLSTIRFALTGWLRSNWSNAEAANQSG